LVVKKVVFGERIEMGLLGCALTMTKRKANLLLEPMGQYFDIAGRARGAMALWCIWVSRKMRLDTNCPPFLGPLMATYSSISMNQSMMAARLTTVHIGTRLEHKMQGMAH
jgi:hypothetical protein